jgi:hypothetical protein
MEQAPTATQQAQNGSGLVSPLSASLEAVGGLLVRRIYGIAFIHSLFDLMHAYIRR